MLVMPYFLNLLEEIICRSCFYKFKNSRRLRDVYFSVVYSYFVQYAVSLLLALRGRLRLLTHYFSYEQRNGLMTYS